MPKILIPSVLRLPLLLILSFALGAVSSFAMAPYNCWAVLLPALSLLYVLIASASSPRRAALFSWLYGLGYFLVGLWWIGNALLVEGNEFAWVWPISVIGLPLLLSVFPALAGYVSARFLNLKTGFGFFGFTAVLLLCEWLRGNILTGFPWNLFGYSWADVPALVQSVSLGGIYFLTWMTIIWMAAPGFLYIVAKSGTLKKTGILPAAFALLSFLALYAFGASRIADYVPAALPDTRVLIVQPNIAQAEKWDRSRMTENFFTHLKMSYPPQDPAGVTYIVWPETALSHWYTQDPTSMGLITQALQSWPGQTSLITGLLRREPESGGYSNSVVQIKASGEITNIYDKTHLVPFGEFIPFQRWIPIKPVADFSGFQKGSGASVYDTGAGQSYTPLICYEVIFPGAAPVAASPDFFVNVTNDAWYGDSAGPYQHFSISRFRAVEDGIPLIRAANTGISALIDPLGRVVYSATLMESASAYLEIPEKINTFYKHVPFRNTLLVIMALCVVACAYRRKAANKL